MSTEPGALRHQQTELTRDLILTALANLVCERGVHEFSVHEVAARAGVSHRTVYRHFPNREALLEGLAEGIDARFRARDRVTDPESVAELRGSLPDAFEEFAADEAFARAYVMLSVGARTRSTRREQRTRRVHEALQRELTGELDPAAAEAVTGVVRVLVSAAAWHQLTDEHGLGSRAAGEAVGWVLRLVLDELARGGAPAMDAASDEEEER